MIHTLRPAKERLQRNLSLHAGTTLRRALFNAFNEQPSVLPVLEEDKPTNVRVSDIPTNVRVSDIPTNVRVSDIPTNVRVSDIPTNVRVSDIPTNVRVSDKPTNVRVYEDDAVTNVVVTDPERVRSREERNDALEEEDAVDSVRTTLDESMMRQTCEPLPQIREEESEATEPELPPIAVMESIPKEATHSGTVRDTLRLLARKQGTVGVDSMEVQSFRLVLRDIEREKAFRPLARVVNLEENEKAAKMKVKRMIHHLKDDPENHLHSQIIVDFVAERNAACVWYVLQNVATDLSGGCEVRA